MPSSGCDSVSIRDETMLLSAQETLSHWGEVNVVIWRIEDGIGKARACAGWLNLRTHSDCKKSRRHDTRGTGAIRGRETKCCAPVGRTRWHDASNKSSRWNCEHYWNCLRVACHRSRARDSVEQRTTTSPCCGSIRSRFSRRTRSVGFPTHQQPISRAYRSVHRRTPSVTRYFSLGNFFPRRLGSAVKLVSKSTPWVA